jgi:hypothetical protein
MLRNFVGTSFLLYLLSAVTASETINSAGELIDAAKVGDAGLSGQGQPLIKTRNPRLPLFLRLFHTLV